MKIKSILVLVLMTAGAARAQETTETHPTSQPHLEENPTLVKRIAELEQQLTQIQQAREQEELDRLVESAETEAATAPDTSEQLEERAYVTASRSLQALNPEISLSGDFVAQAVSGPDLNFYIAEDDRSAVPLLRALDLHIQSSLDPFSFTKVALGFDTRGAAVEELYASWTGVIPRCTLTLGHFRQSLGQINRWHEHDLEQTDYPLALSVLLGSEGLTQSGVSLNWLIPQLLPLTNELTFQVTNGLNKTLFAGDFFSVPTALAHLKNYVDLSEDLYLELGFSGMHGLNNRRGFLDPNANTLRDEPWRATWVGGADLTLSWEPLQRARYQSLTWRSEFFWVSKETTTKNRGYQHGWGAFSYLQYQFAQSWYAGARVDVTQPTQDLRNQVLWQVVPYVTFWQSEFVYIRFQGQHGHLESGPNQTRVSLQVNWAAGPHKHEKY